MFAGTIHDLDLLLEFAKLGVYCQLDLFGVECSLYQLNMHLDMLSDAQRMDKVIALANEGYEDRILMSHDIHTKHRLVSIFFCNLTINLINIIENQQHIFRSVTVDMVMHI